MAGTGLRWGPCDSPVTRVPGARAFPSGRLPLAPRVRHVAEDGGSRAFAGSPQPVEIHHRGIWYSGELLGWRHDADGRVLARVRCVVDRLRHSAWKDLSDLRLPDPANPPHRAVAGPPPRRPPSEADATRPHVLLADLRSRPGQARARPDAAASPQRAARAPALGAGPAARTGQRPDASVHHRPPRAAQGVPQRGLTRSPPTQARRTQKPGPIGAGLPSL